MLGTEKSHDYTVTTVSRLPGCYCGYAAATILAKRFVTRPWVNSSPINIANVSKKNSPFFPSLEASAQRNHIRSFGSLRENSSSGLLTIEPLKTDMVHSRSPHL